MQSHENEHEKHGDQQPATHQHEDSPDFGPEPTPHVAGSVPGAATSEKKTNVTDKKGRDLGNFLLTHYTFALESDPKHKTSPKVSAPGLPKDKKYKQSFLASPYGIKMQGTGLADDGQYIHYRGNNTYGYGVGGAAGKPVAWKTVAVDPHVIKLGSHLDIKTYESKGIFTANDTGGAIKGKHIDIFAGAVPIAEAYSLGQKHSEVFEVEGSGGGNANNDHHGGGNDHPSKPAGGKHTPNEHDGTSEHAGIHHLAGFKHAPTLAQARAGTHMIHRGQEGESVKWIQEKIHSTVGGHFGPITDKNVRHFQAAHKLEVDGIVGPHTMAALDGHQKPGGGGGGNHEHEPPAASGSDPVAIARKYVTHPPTPSIKLKGKLPHFTAAGGETNDCADFVSSVLETAGHVSGHHINVKEFEQALLHQGWKHVTKQNAKAGDVWMNTSRGHTELVSADGATHLIGSNNDRPGHQQITETAGHDGVFLHKAFADHKPANDHKPGNDHKPADDHKPAGDEAAIRNEVHAKAHSHMGAPYSWAAQGPSMFDCSGFSWYVLHTDTHLTSHGRTNAAGLSHAPYTTPTSHPEKGDLVFYAGSGGISHVTIAEGSGSSTIGASGGGPSTHGHDPHAKVKVTDWNHDSRHKTFGSIKKLIEARLHKK